MQRQKVTARWAKSRQTPARSMMHVRGGLGRPGMLVAEGDVVVDIVADRLDAGPARRRGAEQRPGGLASGGRSRSSGCRAGRRGNRRAGRSTGCWAAAGTTGSGRPLSWMTASVRDRRQPGGKGEPAADIVEAVDIFGDRQGGIGADHVRRLEVMDAARDGRGASAMAGVGCGHSIGDFEPDADAHLGETPDRRRREGGAAAVQR